MTTDLHARYTAAEALLPHQLSALVASAEVVPVWGDRNETFWYRNRTGAATQFILVDAEAATKRPAFDHARLAESLSTVLGESFDPDQLPFASIELVTGAVQYTVGSQRIETSLDTYKTTIAGPAHPAETPSPDGRWAVGLRDHNLYLRDTATQEVRQLTTDGQDGHAYAGMSDAVSMLVMQENLGYQPAPIVVWSPDSKRFVTHQIDQRGVELMHLVRSSPPGGGRPKVLSYHYPLVGDEVLATADFVVFDALTGQATRSTCGPILMPFVPAIAYGFVWWDDASSTIHFVWGDRGDRTSRVHRLDPDTGDVTVLVEETSESTILYGPHHNERNVAVLTSGEVLLWSERSGWGHLYMHAPDGTVTTLTSGDWLVRAIVSVDEDARRVVFTAAGREPGSDLYLQELYSVSLDGGDITTITADDLDHDTRPSPSGRFFVDVMSRVDVPAISVLRDAEGVVVLELETADASALYAAGWTPPERVTVKAADGVTDIYCALYLPHGFDPTATYPVIDEIYAGPQSSTVPLRFPQSGGPMTSEKSAAVYAALGFVGVAVNARGTALRHKAFQDHARLGHIGGFVDDHVAAIKQLAATRPWMDLDRVGIHGHSAGAYGSTRALLQAPDLFKVAVASAGNHDDRINHSWWGEKFFGLIDEYDYEAHSNASLAGNLRGKLLLTHGEMDDNATIHGTMRLVDALITANKDFDLLVIPNADHYMLVGREYWTRRRWDYFVEHLMGETPPAYRIADITMDASMFG